MEQIFVVGSGRCGSTLLSSMLQRHPDVVSISEFFTFVTDLGCRVEESFPGGLVSGADFFALIGTAWPRQNLMLRHDVVMDEVLYPWRDPGMRFSADTGVPALSQTALPHLSDAPDVLLDEIQAFCLNLPPAPIAVQYGQLFARLAQQQGANGWVERSGGSLRIVRRLRENFPQARFIHLVRDGRDTAISMSQHQGFRLVFACFQLLEMLGVDPFVMSNRRWEEDLPDELAALLPERFSREAFLAFETPPALCAHYWSGEIIAGLRELEGLPADSLLTLRFEDLVESPAAAVHRLADFIGKGKPNQDWEATAAAMVKSARSRWQALPARDQDELNRACEPGFAALEAQGIRWPDQSVLSSV